MANVRTREPAPATGAKAMWAFFAAMLAQTWGKKADSDGTTYSATGAQVTSGGSGAHGLANTLAWVRIQTASGFEWCIQRGSTNRLWRIKSSLATPFTGGAPSATRVPSAAGEVILLGGGTDAVPVFATLFPADATYLCDFIVQDVSGPPPSAWSTAMIAYEFLGGGDCATVLAYSGDSEITFDSGSQVLAYVGPLWAYKIDVAWLNIGGTGPALAWVTPTPGSVIFKNDPLVVQITTIAGGTFAGLVLVAQFPSGIWETIHDGVAFSGQYDSSTRAPITDGYQFTIVRDGGWTQTPTIRCVAVDTSGNVNA